MSKIVDFVHFHAKRAFKSALVGAEGALIQLALTYVLTEFGGLWYVLSAAIGILVAFTHNYLLNYYWAYKDVINESKRQSEIDC